MDDGRLDSQIRGTYSHRKAIEKIQKAHDSGACWDNRTLGLLHMASGTVSPSASALTAAERYSGIFARSDEFQERVRSVAGPLPCRRTILDFAEDRLHHLLAAASVAGCLNR